MDPVDRRLLLGAAGLASIAALSRRSGAGPLSPPDGAISPTGKTLQQVYDKIAKSDAGTPEARTPIQGLPGSQTALYVITQPGAYYLTGNIQQKTGLACIDIQCDHVDIDGGGWTLIGKIGSSSSCIRSSGHVAIEVYDCAFSGWQGCCIDCDDCDDVSVSDCLFQSCACPPNSATGESGAMVRIRDRGEICDVCVSACDGCTLKTGNDCTVSDCAVDACTGQACRCGDGCCVSDFTVQNCGSNTPSVACIAVGSRCCVDEVDVRNCDSLALSGGSDCVIECCEVTGGSGGAYLCGDGCCIEDCTALDRGGDAFVCGAGCSVSDCKSKEVCGNGIVMGAECVCCDNEVALCSTGGGAGISVGGQRCCVSGNVVSGGGIVVLFGGDGTLIEDNHVRGIAGSPPGTGGGFIAIAQGVSSCQVRDNHTRRESATQAFVIPQGNSYGPIVNCISGGDLSTIPNGSHPHANFVY